MLTYPVISSTKLHKPKRPKKPVAPKIKNASKFCSKNKGKQCKCHWKFLNICGLKLKKGLGGLKEMVDAAIGEV